MPPRNPPDNATGLEKTLRALKAELAKPEHQALVALARHLARSVDADPANAALAKEYRAALVALTTAGAVDDADDDTKSFLSVVRVPPPAPPGRSDPLLTGTDTKGRRPQN